MRRVLNVVVIVLTVVVIAAAVYVIRQSDPVPGAGTVPSSPSTSSVSSSAAPRSSRTVRSSSTTTATGRTTASSTSPTSTSGTAGALRAAFIGDNYTAGDGASAPTKSWASLLARQLDLVGKRFSVSGGGYAKPGDGGRSYDSLVADTVAFKPDLVIVSGGRNDVADDVQTLQDHARQLFADLRSKLPNATIIAVKPWWGDSPHPTELAAVDDAVRAGVTAAKGTYLAVPDALAGHAEWMADGANPNDAGYRGIADALATALRKQNLVQ